MSCLQARGNGGIGMMQSQLRTSRRQQLIVLNKDRTYLKITETMQACLYKIMVYMTYVTLLLFYLPPSFRAATFIVTRDNPKDNKKRCQRDVFFRAVGDL
ncbi:hypothetical protein ATANTOWER_007694 [Ataeniobius toweri]|uniref:Uncharacterized protein n=1 Tax=Ataeniobius toweri TaxID=208326 RepID=A0ABU7C759_9TELE|nr:hypothetical protein [Ataeniobius toweri]